MPSTMEDITQLMRESDDLLRKLIAEDRAPTFEQMLWFQTKLGWDDKQYRKERRRMVSVIRWEQIAGTIADREALEREAHAAETEFKEKGAELEQQIQALTKERNALQRKANQLLKRSDEATDGADRLREPTMLPVAIGAAFNSRRSLINNSLRRALLDVEGEIHHARVQIGIDTTSREGIELVRLNRSDCVVEQNGRQQVTPEWADHVAALKSKLPELEAQRNSARDKYDEACDALEPLLNWYIK